MPKLSSNKDYTLSGKSVWITAKKMSVHIVKTDEGVVVDIYPLGCESDGGGPLASAYAFDSEAEDAIEEALG